VIYQFRLEAIFGEVRGPGYVSVLIAVPVFVAILVQPTVAAISDYTISRWGRRKPYILIGTLLDVVFLWALATSHTFEAILVFVLLLQFSSNFAQGPFQGYVPDLVPARQVGLASALMGVMIVVGQMVGVGIAGLALLQLGPNGLEPGTAAAARAMQDIFFLPTIALGIIELVTMLLLVATIDEGRTAPPRDGRSWVRIALGAWGTDILHQRSFVWMLISRLHFLMVPGLLTGIGVFFLPRAFGIARADVGLAMMVVGGVMGVMTILATIPAARLSDRLGRKRIIYAAIAIGMVGVAVIASAPSFALMLVGLALAGISVGAFVAVDWALITDIIPKATSGRYMGISNAATAMAGPLGLGIGGLTIAALTFIGLPPELRDVATAGPESSLYTFAPRAAVALSLVFFAISALTLRRVDETRRED
jgi:MFS family permease